MFGHIGSTLQHCCQPVNHHTVHAGAGMGPPEAGVGGSWQSLQNYSCMQFMIMTRVGAMRGKGLTEHAVSVLNVAALVLEAG